ncbi:ribosomal RNA processing protein 1 homolog A-like [Cyprinodon tularosa]|uniref:ribosomal RNA processing protein 1 homolog A-like n=1 Tax=Cyprinodon tularosa TaxID=77115 RepID=UPI0018E1FD28|nr:ribosomal RNA processing protein 1 homolog A-like [Cyprinodon tularosa]
MEAVQQPELQLAQRLASNEKSTRSKAMKKLRKYINVRSQKVGGAFTAEELLKLWKGLFYCLWMQDKPLLQEELSHQISKLIHSFHDIDRQLMYLKSFLQTLEREWTGIDRLRMDKFYQLVRFMFRQTFEILKRSNWESSSIGKFLELLKSDLLQKENEVPSGLLLHIMDLYMTELAAVGAAELTAEQNLTFIEPFCRKAAKTKNQTLFSAICKSFFSTIIDQAPFAVEDLMKEVKAARMSESDSGQESEDDDDELEEDDRPVRKNRAGQLDDENDLEVEEESEDELLHQLESDSELPDEDIGPVLQFNYSDLADELFKLARRKSTPGHNRQKLYKIIKVLRDLSQGTFPQDEYPEEVSTDEDDDMFGSRKRMKRAAPKGDRGKPAEKKSKVDRDGKKKEPDGQSDTMEPADEVPVNDEKINKKKKKKKTGAEDAKSLQCSEAQPLDKRRLQPTLCKTVENQPKTEKGLNGISDAVLTEEEEVQQTATSDTSSDTLAPASGKKKNTKKGQKAEAKAQSVSADDSLPTESPVASAEERAQTPAKNKKKHRKAEGKEVQQSGPNEAPVHDLMPELRAETPISAKKKIQKMKEEHKVVAHTDGARSENSAGEITSSAQHKKITKKKGKQEVNTDEIQQTGSESRPAGETTPTPRKGKKNLKGEKMTGGSENTPMDAATMKRLQKKRKSPICGADQLDEVGNSSADPEQPAAEAEIIRSPEKKAKIKKKKIQVQFEFEADELEGTTANDSMTEVKSKSPKTKPNNMQSTPHQSKKVRFGLRNNKTAEFKKTDLTVLLSPEGSSRVPFDPQQKPKFGVLKSPPTPVSSGSKKTPKKNRGKLLQATPKGRPLGKRNFF